MAPENFHTNPNQVHWKFLWVRDVKKKVLLGGSMQRRRSGLMISALNSGTGGAGSSPGQGHCVVFLGKTLTLTVPLSTQVH